MLLLPPLGSLAIIAPVFLNGCDLSIYDTDERGCVAGHTSILVVHMGGGDDVSIGCNDPLHLAIPLPGIFAVRPDKFLYSEMLVCVMPVYIVNVMEVFTDGICILPQNGIPKLFGLYVNSWGRDKKEIIASRVGVKASARFLCTAEEDSVSEITEVTHPEADPF